MLAIMVAFFGVIITVNVTMAVLANRTWTGLVVKNSYVASQNFNAELEEARRQEARGWQSKLSYDGATVTFELSDRANAPVVLEGLKAMIGRPATERDDHVVMLSPASDGKYVGATELGAGHWDVRITGGSGEMAYRQDARLFVKNAAASAGPAERSPGRPLGRPPERP